MNTKNRETTCLLKKSTLWLIKIYSLLILTKSLIFLAHQCITSVSTLFRRTYLTFLWHLVSWVTASKFLHYLLWYQILLVFISLVTTTLNLWNQLLVKERNGDASSITKLEKKRKEWEENQGAVTKRKRGVLWLLTLGLQLDYLSTSVCISHLRTLLVGSTSNLGVRPDCF